MSDDLDPRLAELLRRAPSAPMALDEAHRQAVLHEARQAWFRAQGRRRRTFLATAAAACLAAGVAGWSLRVVSETPLPTGPAMTAAQSVPVVLPAAAPPPAPAGASMVDAVGGSFAVPEATMAKALGSEAPAEQERHEALATPAANHLAEVPLAARQDAAPARRARAADLATRDGRIVLAGLVLTAEREGRLPPAERIAALRAARMQLDGLDLPEAQAQRAELDRLLRSP